MMSLKPILVHIHKYCSGEAAGDARGSHSVRGVKYGSDLIIQQSAKLDRIVYTGDTVRQDWYLGRIKLAQCGCLYGGIIGKEPLGPFDLLEDINGTSPISVPQRN